MTLLPAAMIDTGTTNVCWELGATLPSKLVAVTLAGPHLKLTPAPIVMIWSTVVRSESPTVEETVKTLLHDWFATAFGIVVWYGFNWLSMGSALA